MVVLGKFDREPWLRSTSVILSNTVRPLVEEEPIGWSLDNPLNRVCGSILGRQSFIKESLGRLRDAILQREEISYRREL